MSGARAPLDALLSPHGSFLPALLGHGLADRLRGRRARANARWGFLHAPAAGGKLVWIRTGGERSGVRLAVGLARALRERRLDVRLVLTFEHEHPGLLDPLAELAKTGWGYSPCDHRLAVRRVLSRLDPLGVICVGTPPRPRLAAALRERAHSLVVSAAASDCAAERVYPATDGQLRGWPAGTPVAPRADLLTLLTVAQVDPNFASGIDGSGRPLWWWHGDDIAAARAFVRRFREALPDSVLFVSGRATAAFPGDAALQLSRWTRSGVAPGTLICVDDPRWLPAVAASVTAVHLAAVDRETLWQALAGGCAPSCARVADLPAGELAPAVPGIADPAAVLRHWLECRDNPIAARAAGDSARRAFWRERRRAADVNAELLARVFDWN